jgi:phage shock protein PspC (stress-responsive transcriptional regulator)
MAIAIRNGKIYANLMNEQKLKLIVCIGLIAALGAVVSAFAAGSHFHIGFLDGSFSFDFRVGTGRSAAASVLGMVALACFLAGAILYFASEAQAGGGTAAGSTHSPQSAFAEVIACLRRLGKSKNDVWFGGVCGGLGEHTPFPPWMWRLVFLVLVFCYGTGVLGYLLLWICLPESPAPDRHVAFGPSTGT